MLHESGLFDIRRTAIGVSSNFNEVKFANFGLLFCDRYAIGRIHEEALVETRNHDDPSGQSPPWTTAVFHTGRPARICFAHLSSKAGPTACRWCHPSVERVEEMLQFEGRPHETVIAQSILPPDTNALTCTLFKLRPNAAVNAVMAGCKAEYFPVVIAAFEAMNEPEFNFHGSTASTGGSAPLLVVSGEMADDLGMNSDVNLFGPGNRANATMCIGRAVRLILMNVFRMIPGVSDKSTASPRQSRQVQLLYRRAPARQPLAFACRGTGLPRRRQQRDCLCRWWVLRRVLQCRKSWRQHTGARFKQHRGRNGQLRLYYARPIRRRHGA